MRLRFAIGILVVALSICTGADEGDLRHKLAIQSQNNGLALAASTGDQILVIPFDGRERHFQAEYRFSILTFGKSGRMVSWWFRKQDFFDIYGQFVVSAIDGHTIARTTPTISGFRPIALSEAAKRVAFWAGGESSTGASSLYWSPFDLSKPGLIDNRTGEPDWSPDGRALVYAKEGKIYIFDISSASSRLLAEGHDPTWSPNGKWIALVAPDGHASLFTPGGMPVSWSLSQHRPISPMRWSPEGDFVSFTEKLPTLYALLDAVARVVVCRVSDGTTMTVRNLNSESVDWRAFYWISEYRTFCAKCAPVDSVK